MYMGRLSRWLCQLRVAPYSYDCIDNGGSSNPKKLTPGTDQLVLGQRMMKSFKLVDFEFEKHLTLLVKHTTSKSESRLEFVLSRLYGNLAVSYLIVPSKIPNSCRLLVKIVVQYPSGILGWLTPIFLPWGDKIMMRKQLLNFKKLSENNTSRQRVR